jgi:hypothetical protein
MTTLSHEDRIAVATILAELCDVTPERRVAILDEAARQALAALHADEDDAAALLGLTPCPVHAETVSWQAVSRRQPDRPTVGYSEAEMRALYGDR